MNEHDLDDDRAGTDTTPDAQQERPDDEDGRTTPGDLSIQLDRLEVASHLGRTSIDAVADRLSKVAGQTIAVETGRVTTGFVKPDALESTFGQEHRVAVRLRLRGPPYGHVLALFDLASANRTATLMLENSVEDLESVSNDLAHDAVKELGAMMANGMTDALADVVGREIDVGTPQLSSTDERTIMRRTVTDDDGYGLYLASTVRVPEQDVTTDVYLFPDTETFLRLLGYLETEEIV